MAEDRQVIGVSSGELISLLVNDLKTFTSEEGGKALYSPADPLSWTMVSQMINSPPNQGGILITTLGSLGSDQTEGSIGHVVKMNMRTYVICQVGLPIERTGDSIYEGNSDFVSKTIKRVMTFGFPKLFTGVVQSFVGYTPVSTAEVSTNKNLLCGVIDHSVWVTLPGTNAFVCNPITDSTKKSLIAMGWRFGEII